MKETKWIEDRWMGVAAGVVVLVAMAIFVWISVVNHNRLMTFGWDLGFYDQIVWQVSRGMVWPVTSFFEGEMATWTIRFSPILMLMAPLYWVWADARVLLVVQAVAAALGAWPMWVLARERFRKGAVGGWVGLAAVIAYVSFIGLQRAVFFDFHPDVVMATLLGWLLVMMERGRVRASLVVALGVMLCKEWAGLLVAGVGAMRVAEVWLRGKRQVDGLGWRLMIMGVAGFGVIIYGLSKPVEGVDITAFGYGAVGETPGEVVWTAVSRPWVVIQELVWPVVKVETVVKSLLQVGFLPLLSPITLIPIGVQFGVRFLDGSHQQAWTMNYHYSATLTPLLVYGAIRGIKKLERWNRRSKDWGKLGVLVLVVGAVGGMVYFHAPVFSVLKPEFYRENERVVQVRQMVERIPDGVVVAAQNNLMPHVSGRSGIYPLPKIADAEYVVVDLEPGQSDYNFSWASEAEVADLIEGLVERGEFEWWERMGEAGVLRRK